MSVNVLDKNIKDTVARIVTTICSYSMNVPYNELYKRIRFELRTVKGFKSMVNLGIKYGKKIKDKNVENLLVQLMFCQELYFANK